MEKRYLIAAAGILLAFAVGLVGYFAFSAMHNDGLEKVMEENGVQEGEPVYHAPFDYGSSYSSALLAGLVGFGVTLGAVYGYMKLRKRSEKAEQ